MLSEVDKLIIDELRGVIKEDTPTTIVSIIFTNIKLADDCIERIKKEGSVVRDLKGNVIAHPSIAIKNNADEIIAKWTLKFKKPVINTDYNDEDYNE